MPAVRTHLWSQPTICERTSYRAKMGISRMKWKCVPGEHHMSETCRHFSAFWGANGKTTAYRQERSSPRYVHNKEKAPTQTSCAQNQGSKDSPAAAAKSSALYHMKSAAIISLRHLQVRLPHVVPTTQIFWGTRGENGACRSPWDKMNYSDVDCSRNHRCLQEGYQKGMINNNAYRVSPPDQYAKFC